MHIEIATRLSSTAKKPVVLASNRGHYSSNQIKLVEWSVCMTSLELFFKDKARCESAFLSFHPCPRTCPHGGDKADMDLLNSVADLGKSVAELLNFALDLGKSDTDLLNSATFLLNSVAKSVKSVADLLKSVVKLSKSVMDLGKKMTDLSKSVVKLLNSVTDLSKKMEKLIKLSVNLTVSTKY